VERWNSGFSKDIIHFKLYRQNEFCHLSNIAGSQAHYSAKASLRAQYSNIPSFHHSPPSADERSELRAILFKFLSATLNKRSYQ
jgi:hypothetical protein